MGKILECKDISYAYHTVEGEIEAVKHMSFKVEEGDFVSIVGPSGCGKSTLLNMLTGIIEPESGSITLYYKNQRKPNNSSLHNGLNEYYDSSENYDSSDYYGYMPQQDQLFEWYSIYKNVTLPLRIRHQLTSENKDYIDQLLKQYDLIDFKNKKPSELSGGMRQRAALIRTLACKPSLLYLDEPFSALDYQNRLKAADDIGQIIQKEHKTAILVTHDISEAISLSNKIFILSNKPATIIKEIHLPYQDMKLSAMQVRSMPDFHSYFNEIWEALNYDKTK